MEEESEWRMVELPWMRMAVMEPLLVRRVEWKSRFGILLGVRIVGVLTFMEPDRARRSRVAGVVVLVESSRERLMLMLPDCVWMVRVSERVKSPLTLPDWALMVVLRESIAREEGSLGAEILTEEEGAEMDVGI